METKTKEEAMQLVRQYSEETCCDYVIVKTDGLWNCGEYPEYCSFRFIRWHACMYTSGYRGGEQKQLHHLATENKGS